MKSLTRRLWQANFFVVLVLSIVVQACTGQPENGKTNSVTGSADPVPDDPTTIEAQLSRYLGQTSFLSLKPEAHKWPWLVASQAEDYQDSSEERVVAEADLYQLGPEGSGLLFLLNPFRGLQIIDFSDGVEQARLLARTDATGQEPIDMYYWKEQQQIIIQERVFTDENGNWLEQPYGMILVYSVRDPSHPQLLQRLKLEGDLADSRRVGEVLYVASSIWAYGQNQASGSGQITSYQLTSSGLREITKLSLNLPVQSRESLQVITSRENNQNRYYVALTLTENYWSFRNRQSTIEVVDISDPRGQMERLMQVSSRGVVPQRSAVSIKDRTLIVVSNYWQSLDGGDIRRVAVEGFRLPDADATIISQHEGQFRQLWIERELRRRGLSMDELEQSGLLEHPEYGLKGVFITSGEDQISKWVPDSYAVSGDTTGLSAQIQDVRFVEDLLYVFWVPQNFVDPLDIFDISQPAKQIKFLNRTYFDGWIERSVPIYYQGRHFILGIGWIIPADDNTAQRRAQAMLFEVIRNDNGEITSKILDQLTLRDTNTWANLSESDKTITVRIDEQARGFILFPYLHWGSELQQGGKLIGFDIGAGLTGTASFLSEGALLTAPISWLRRVFENPEIQRLHILTDQSLASYQAPQDGVGQSDEILQSVHLLELARDILAFGLLDSQAGQYAVQIVAADYGLSLPEAATEIRLVDRKYPDASKSEVLTTYTIPGRYMAMAIDGSMLYVLSLQAASEMNSEATSADMQRWVLHRLQPPSPASPGVEMLADSVSWDRNLESLSRIMEYIPWYGLTEVKFLKAADGTLALVTDQEFRIIASANQALAVQSIDLQSCLLEDAENVDYHVLGQGFAVSFDIFETTPAHMQGLQLVRPYLNSIELSPSGSRCNTPVNIPGMPLIQARQELLMTKDQRFLAWEQWQVEGNTNDSELAVKARPTSDWGLSAHSAPAYLSLHIAAGKATLLDLYGLEGQQTANEISQGSQLYLIERIAQYSSQYLSLLSLSEQGRFHRKVYVIPASYGETPLEILRILEDGSTGHLLLVKALQTAQIFRLNSDTDYLQPIKAREILANRTASQPLSSIQLRHYYGGDREERIHFDPYSHSLIFAEGLWGVRQFELDLPQDGI